MAMLAVLIIVLRRAIRHGHLALVVPRVLTIIAEAEEGPLKPAVTLGRPMTVTATELAHLLGTAVRTSR
jgi:hypothetical protein